MAASRDMKATVIAVLAMMVMVLTAVTAFGATAGAQSATDDPDQVEAGGEVFASNCAGCHAEDGTGVSGLGRPLTGIADQEADRMVHIASVIDGKGTMPAFGERLTADEIDAVVSFVRIGFAAEEAAAETTAETTEELAETGASTMPLVIAAITAVMAGVLLADRSRRQLRS